MFFNFELLKNISEISSQGKFYLRKPSKGTTTTGLTKFRCSIKKKVDGDFLNSEKLLCREFKIQNGFHNHNKVFSYQRLFHRHL